MKELEFLDSALADIEAVRDYYAEFDPDLVGRFGQNLMLRLREIQAHPKSCRKISSESRRANLSKFPYAIFYQEEADCLLIQAVFHQAGHPSVWARRLT